MNKDKKIMCILEKMKLNKIYLVYARLIFPYIAKSFDL